MGKPWLTAEPSRRLCSYTWNDISTHMTGEVWGGWNVYLTESVHGGAKNSTWLISFFGRWGGGAGEGSARPYPNKRTLCTRFFLCIPLVPTTRKTTTLADTIFVHVPHELWQSLRSPNSSSALSSDIRRVRSWTSSRSVWIRASPVCSQCESTPAQRDLRGVMSPATQDALHPIRIVSNRKPSHRGKPAICPLGTWVSICWLEALMLSHILSICLLCTFEI